jgi:hypothetical protein
MEPPQDDRRSLVHRERDRDTALDRRGAQAGPDMIAARAALRELAERERAAIGARRAGVRDDMSRVVSHGKRPAAGTSRR